MNTNNTPNYEATLPEVASLITEKQATGEEVPVVVLGRDDLTNVMKAAVAQYLPMWGDRAIIMIDLMETVRAQDLAKRDITDLEWARLNTIGFFVLNESGDYVDIDAESIYERDDQGCHKSFNLNMSINRDENTISFQFGENKGEGFDEYIWFAFKVGMDVEAELLTQVAALKIKATSVHQENFCNALKFHSEAFSNILSSASCVGTWLNEKV